MGSEPSRPPQLSLRVTNTVFAPTSNMLVMSTGPRAELFVQSDKLAKQARFVMDKPVAPTTVTEMVLLDQLSNHKETRVRYVSRQPRAVPESWLNPMFLAHNPSLD